MLLTAALAASLYIGGVAAHGGVIAYTLIASTNIYFCSIFFNEVAHSRLCSGTTVASRNVRGGTTLHEITHAVSNTDDVTYGCAADQALSDSRKIINADSYNVRISVDQEPSLLLTGAPRAVLRHPGLRQYPVLNLLRFCGPDRS